ncbi:hypothetical protein SXIM_54690 [Streptomyces xiamenensis]|uniref:Uncharacterized protein n=1 Tax=Streptomyces xiamenensis TaxID=408015 RepID=A0A0F7G1X2_9ACTN|nr:hypothetical protein [Streptomyces xiamenensis]AKG46853.1 hypothetical protein SXIM_54690 [Streptomyces xiamenensis]
MMQITLDKKKDAGPNSDPLQRSQIGWSDGLCDQQLHDIARGVWVMPGSRVEREPSAVINSGRSIRQAIEIGSWTGCTRPRMQPSNASDEAAAQAAGHRGPE